LSAGISAAREGARRGWSSLRIDRVPGQVCSQVWDGSLMASESRDMQTAKRSFTFLSLSLSLSLSSTTSPFPVSRWMIRQAQCRSTRSTLDPPSDPLDPSALGHPRLGLDTLRVATAAALIDVFPRGVCVMRELLRACGRSL